MMVAEAGSHGTNYGGFSADG